MPVQQRYTPVPGMGSISADLDPEMRQAGNASSEGGPYGCYGNNNQGSELSPFYDGNVPAPHRFSSYSDTSRMSLAPTDPFITPRSSYLDTQTSSSQLQPQPQMSQTQIPNNAYANIPSERYWPEANTTPVAPGHTRRNRLLKIGGLVVLGLAVVGVVVGVVVSQVTKKGGGSESGSGSGQSGGAVISGGDASSFEKDSRLHQSFWGFAYTPQGTVPPACGATQANVTRDIQMLSQLTTRIRLYGANCNATALVLQAIQDTKVDITIWPAVYVDSNEDAYTTQVAAIKSAIGTYGTDHIEGIIVGNEYILNTAGTASLTSSTYTSAVKTIQDKIQEVNTTILGMSLDKHLPIGTSDAGSILSTGLAEGIDFFMANVHPYFGSLAIDQAAAWTNNFFQEFDVDVAAQASNNPATYIAETGWPTASATTEDANSGAGSPEGDASVANLQTFLDTFVCQANTNGTNYFFFEAFDEPSKAIYGGVEPYWGLFDSDRNLNNVTIPTC